MAPQLNAAPADLGQMELSVLQKLHFTLFVPSALEFAQVSQLTLPCIDNLPRPGTM